MQHTEENFEKMGLFIICWCQVTRACQAGIQTFPLVTSIESMEIKYYHAQNRLSKVIDLQNETETDIF